MITNERQFKITKAELARLHAALRELEEKGRAGASDPADELLKASFVSQIEEFTELTSEYEKLLSDKESRIAVRSFGDLPVALIKARIKMGLTQKDLAERLSVKEQQVQRWEASSYANISFSNLRKVVDALGVLVNE